MKTTSAVLGMSRNFVALGGVVAVAARVSVAVAQDCKVANEFCGT